MYASPSLHNTNQSAYNAHVGDTPPCRAPPTHDLEVFAALLGRAEGTPARALAALYVGTRAPSRGRFSSRRASRPRPARYSCHGTNRLGSHRVPIHELIRLPSPIAEEGSEGPPFAQTPRAAGTRTPPTSTSVPVLFVCAFTWLRAAPSPDSQRPCKPRLSRGSYRSWHTTRKGRRRSGRKGISG